jgi:thiol-disulfide isomerase/thioredoxin
MLPVKSKAPDFDLATVDGQHYRLSALRGHPVLLEFFAVWCPHCQREAPILNRIDQAFASQGLRSLLILANPYGHNYDVSGGTDRRLANRGDIAWFQQTFKVAHPILIDPTFATVNRYGVNGYPTIYVLDRKGVIRSATSGEVPYQQLAAAVAAASQR